MTPYTVSPSDVATFERDGVVCLRGVLDASWIDKLRRGVDNALAHPGPMARVNSREGDGGRFSSDYGVWTFDPDFRDFVLHSPLGAVAASLLRSRNVFFLVDLMLVKEPGTPTPTPWHQDQPYGWYDGDQVLGCWVGLDPTDRSSGAVEWIRGSHRSGRFYRPRAFDRTTDYGGSGLDELPDIDQERDRHDIVHFDTEPGDVVINHIRTIHGAPGNATARRRRAITFRYGGDDSRYAVRPGAPRPIRDPGLAHGDRFGCELFPQVWPQAPAERGA